MKWPNILKASHGLTDGLFIHCYVCRVRVVYKNISVCRAAGMYGNVGGLVFILGGRLVSPIPIRDGGRFCSTLIQLGQCTRTSLYAGPSVLWGQEGQSLTSLDFGRNRSKNLLHQMTSQIFRHSYGPMYEYAWQQQGSLAAIVLQHTTAG